MNRAILVLNTGSSSIKFTLFRVRERTVEPTRLCEGQIEHIGNAPRLTASNRLGVCLIEETLPADCNAIQALQRLLAWLEPAFADVELVAAAHRVVHGGSRYRTSAIVDAVVLDELRRLIPLAPLHQPQAVAAIEALQRSHPTLAQIACFDTAFHHTLPLVASSFALPYAITDDGVRRYGFHGLSYEYIASVFPQFADAEVAGGRVVVAHLGSGASMCAMLGGRSIATTMGLTPLDGLPMSRRCGALDPGVVLYLLQEKGMSTDEVANLLYHESGLFGVSGISDDMHALLASTAPRAKAAIDLFVYHVIRELGSLAGALGGLDALVFTAGIGEHAPEIRSRVCAGAAWLGIALDATNNTNGGPRISLPGSRVSAWVIPTDEDMMIVQHCMGLLG